MLTAIEISGSTIRCCRSNDGKLSALESYPIAEGTDPLEAFASVPLQGPLGRVTVVLHHADLLLRTMVQPPCPEDRLDRIVRFELQGQRGDDTEPLTLDWHLVRSGGSGDMRILSLSAKQSLVTRLRSAVARHDGKLVHVVPPGVGLFHAWHRQTGGANEDAVIIDVGGEHAHLALIKEGELLLVRSQAPGMAPLAKDIAEAQGIPLTEARTLVSRLGQGSPQQHHDLIKRHVQGVATLISNNIRFAKAQLQLDQFEAKAVYICGAGAQVFGFTDHLKDRLQIPVRLLNPFAGVLSSMSSSELDKQSALPSPWTNSLGGMAAETFELDALNEERTQRNVFWRTDGALRVACIFAAAMILLAFARQQTALSSVNNTIETLKGEAEDGLVPKAEALDRKLVEYSTARDQAANAIAFLDGERRPGRIAVELLGAVSQLQDPESCPVVLRHYRVARQNDHVLIELEGFAETARNKSAADVLRLFEHNLAKAYAPVGSMTPLPKPSTTGRQEFAYKVVVPDEPVSVTAKASAVLEIEVLVPPSCDPKGAAQVALDRQLRDQQEATVTVRGLGDTGKILAEFAWNPRNGLSSRR